MFCVSVLNEKHAAEVKAGEFEDRQNTWAQYVMWYNVRERKQKRLVNKDNWGSVWKHAAEFYYLFLSVIWSVIRLLFTIKSDLDVSFNLYSKNILREKFSLMLQLAWL